MSSNSNDGSSCVDDMAKNADPNLAKLCGDKELSELRKSDADVEDPKVTRWNANEWKSIRAKDLMNNKDPKSMPSEIEKGRPNRAAPMINVENATWTQLRRNEDEPRCKKSNVSSAESRCPRECSDNTKSRCKRSKTNNDGSKHAKPVGKNAEPSHENDLGKGVNSRCKKSKTDKVSPNFANPFEDKTLSRWARSRTSIKDPALLMPQQLNLLPSCCRDRVDKKESNKVWSRSNSIDPERAFENMENDGSKHAQLFVGENDSKCRGSSTSGKKPIHPIPKAGKIDSSHPKDCNKSVESILMTSKNDSMNSDFADPKIENGKAGCAKCLIDSSKSKCEESKRGRLKPSRKCPKGDGWLPAFARSLKDNKKLVCAMSKANMDKPKREVDTNNNTKPKQPRSRTDVKKPKPARSKTKGDKSGRTAVKMKNRDPNCPKDCINRENPKHVASKGREDNPGLLLLNNENDEPNFPVLCSGRISPKGMKSMIEQENSKQLMPLGKMMNPDYATALRGRELSILMASNSKTMEPQHVIPKIGTVKPGLLKLCAKRGSSRQVASKINGSNSGFV